MSLGANGGIRFFGKFVGANNHDLDSKTDDRFTPLACFSVDLTGFTNLYDRLITPQAVGVPRFQPTPSPARLVLPLQFTNGSQSQSHGVEVTSTWQPLQAWKVASSYTWLDLKIAAKRPVDPNESVDPAHQLNVISYLSLPGSIEVDTTVFKNGKVYGLLPGYTTVDQRLAWRPTSHLELSAGARNLFDQHHLEFPVDAHGIRTRVIVGRTGYGTLTWRF